MRYRGAQRCLLGLAVFLAGASAAPCLTDEEIFREFRFNFINPGARSLALGGAFISVADDATSAQANPAGLSILLRPEYFIELRGVDNGGDTTLIREDLAGGLENAFGSGTNLSDAHSFTFAGVVFPFKRITFGASRQEVLNTESRTLSVFGLSNDPSSGVLSASAAGFLNMHLITYNASAGVRISDRFSLGASITYDTLKMDSEVSSYMVDPNGFVTGTPIPQATLDLRTRTSDSDDALGFTLGTIFKPVDSISLGAVYRYVPRLEVSEELQGGTDLFGVRSRLGSEFGNVLDIPDSYGIGASWRPQQRLTLALDVERVLYSDLLSGYVSGVNILTVPDARFTVDDATNVRLGGEWILLTHRNVPLAFRGGVYTQPDSTIHALSVPKKDLPSGPSIHFATKDVFPPGSDEVHWAAGLGIVSGRMKIDLGMDIGPDSNEFLVSFIVQGD